MIKRKHLFILAIPLLLAANLIAQNEYDTHKDSTFDRSITLKINPTLLLEEVGIGGEYGASAQIPINDCWTVSAGGGLNTSSFGTANLTYGYTIRAAVYHFLDTKIYVSLQLMFRKWGTVDNADNYSGVFNNSLLNPFDGTFNTPVTSTGPYGNGNPLPYDVDNVTMTSYGIDVVFGHQGPLFKSKHFMFEYYLGLGVRLHSYSIEKIGRYDNYMNTMNIEYEPLATPVYSSNLTVYPDLKLGCMIGYRF